MSMAVTSDGPPVEMATPFVVAAQASTRADDGGLGPVDKSTDGYSGDDVDFKVEGLLEEGRLCKYQPS